MSAAPTVAVALSVKDGADYLGEAIESILAQDGVRLELRIYDNLSTDDSYAIAQSYAGDGRVTVVRGPQDYAFCGSMNRALSETSAEFFAPWSADDVMLPGNLAAKARAARDLDAAWSFGPMHVIGPDGGVLFTQEPYLDPSAGRICPPTVFQRFIPENKLPASGPVLRTDALLAAGGFDARIPKCPDWKLWLEFGLRHDLAWLPEPLFSYRWHDASGTNGAWTTGAFARDLLPTLRHVFAAADVPAELAAEGDHAYVLLCAYLAGQMRERGRTRVGEMGHSSVTVMGDAVLRVAEPAEAWTQFRAEAAAAGLVPPAPAADVLAAPAATRTAVFETVAAMRRLHERGVSRSLALTCPEADADRLVPLVEDSLREDGDLDLTLVLAPALTDVLAPGMLFLAPHGSAAVGVAEAQGVAAITLGVPDPLARPRRADAWELPVAAVEAAA
jgi:Glycosyl transferase family 2